MPAVLIRTECRGMFDTHRINIEGFCSDRGFLFHRNGSGAWGNDRYWTYYKVENNDRTVFSIEYFPVRNYLKICHGNSCYQGTPESLEHMLELLSAMRIDIEELAIKTGRMENQDTKLTSMRPRLKELNDNPMVLMTDMPILTGVLMMSIALNALS